MREWNGMEVSSDISIFWMRHILTHGSVVTKDYQEVDQLKLIFMILT